MTVHELTREQLIELKQHMLCEQGSPSYGELADADGRVGTDEIFDFLLTGHAFSSP